MGSPPGAAFGKSDEGPQRKVKLAPYRLGRTPVTWKQYRAFEPEHSPRIAGNLARDLHPVTEVDWWRAWLFCRWLGGDLPTEAQWEAACRAGTTTAYSFGNDEAELGNYAWYRDNARRSTQPVGTKRANRWGLHDLHGNVWEWCRDWYGRYEGQDVDDPSGSAAGAVRVLRGGFFWNDAGRCRSACRFGFLPWGRSVDVGFRVALPPPPDRPSSLDPLDRP
ncbi:MAG: formylglycine-generating enzyme family protein [Planctomycetes bacterium]|nr:formylglycine-generating enzyme family protein [Planctomycetota bacterium]